MRGHVEALAPHSDIALDPSLKLPLSVVDTRGADAAFHTQRPPNAGLPTRLFPRLGPIQRDNDFVERRITPRLRPVLDQRYMLREALGLEFRCRLHRHSKSPEVSRTSSSAASSGASGPDTRLRSVA
jgi:hypothetical protein